MSHILDALRQAEDERRLGKAPNRSAIASPLRAARRRGGASWLRWAVLLFFLLGLTIVLWLAYARLQTQGPAPSSVAPQDATEGGQPQAASSTAAVTRTATIEPLPVPPLAQERTTAAVEPPPTPPADTGTDGAARMERMPRAQLADAQRIDSLDALFEGPEETPARNPSDAGPTEAAPAAAPLQPQDIFRNPAASRADATPPPAPDRAAPDSSALNVAEWADLPRASRVDMPAIRIDVHVYNQDPERRFVRINGQRRVEGDRLENNAVIEAITPEGLVLRWGGMRLAQPLDR